ncbi:MAG: ArsR family transcriptional regulator [Desulfuromonadales bacterium]|nr:ArsR family transcriptional regulator [Desulfuromonadales bacterium]
MPSSPRPPVVPAFRGETVRQRIVDLLRGSSLTPREISAEVGIQEKEVARHLEHIRKSLQSAEGRLEIDPATCRKCGFVFTKRERLDRPGRCPVCRGQSIAEPRFLIRMRGEEAG